MAALTPNCTQRNYSNVAPQSLLMMNSLFTTDHAEQFADRLMREGSEPRERIAKAWQLVYSRPIEPAMIDRLSSYLAEQTKALRAKDAKRSDAEVERLALATLCQVLVSSNAFLYVD